MVLGEAFRKYILCTERSFEKAMDTSANGWTNNEIALKWLSKVFILHTKPTDLDQWRMLIVKGHGSYTTKEFM